MAKKNVFQKVIDNVRFSFVQKTVSKTRAKNPNLLPSPAAAPRRVPSNGFPHGNSTQPGSGQAQAIKALYRAVAMALMDLQITQGQISIGQNITTPGSITIRLLPLRAMVINKAKAIEAAVLVHSRWPGQVSVQHNGGYLDVVFFLPENLQSVKLGLADLPDPLAVGITVGGKPVRIELNDRTRYALKIFGIPGSGKTTLVKAILYQILSTRTDDLKLIICDPKQDLVAFAQARQTVWYVDHHLDYERVVYAWCDEIARRKHEKDRSRGDYLLVVDEADEVLQDKTLRERVTSTLQIGRAFGARMIYINQVQKAGRTNSHKNLLDVIGFWIQGKTASARQGSHQAGQAGSQANKLDGAGMFEIGMGDRSVQFNGVYMEDDTILSLPQDKRERPLPPPTIVEVDAAPPAPGGRPEVRPTESDVALALEYEALRGNRIPYRVARDHFGVTRTRWDKLPVEVTRHQRIELLRGRVRGVLVKKGV